MFWIDSTGPGGLDPTLQLPHNQTTNEADSSLAVIEARDGGKVDAAMVAEDFGVLAGDLLQGFQAIGSKTRRDHGEALHAALRKLLYRGVGIGLEPFRRSEARLEGEHQPALVEAEARAQEPHRLGALVAVRVAARHIVLGHAVE